MKTINKQVFFALVLFCCTGLLACNEASKPHNKNAQETAPMNRQQQIKQEAQADAQQAIQELDFRLLAQRNKGTSIPGIDLEKYELTLLVQQCGLLFMQNSGDEILQRSELNLRQEQYIYALIYNNVILPACLAQFELPLKK